MKRKYVKMHILFAITGTTLTIDLRTYQVENWLFDTGIYIQEKTSDNCMLKFETQDGQLLSYKGYVPDWFPEQHYGDYIMLGISKEGEADIKVTDTQITKTLKSFSNYLRV